MSDEEHVPIYVTITLLDSSPAPEGQVGVTVSTAIEYTPGLTTDQVATILWTTATSLDPSVAGRVENELRGGTTELNRRRRRMGNTSLARKLLGLVWRKR